MLPKDLGGLGSAAKPSLAAQADIAYAGEAQGMGPGFLPAFFQRCRLELTPAVTMGFIAPAAEAVGALDPGIARVIPRLDPA